MFTRLYDKFPQITGISKIVSPTQLVIRSKSPIINPDARGVRVFNFSICIDCANTRDIAEPYTQETLEKAIIEFPVEYEKRVLSASGKLTKCRK
jgi:hypothetical protein